VFQLLAKYLQGKTLLGRLRSKWEDNIIMDKGKGIVVPVLFLTEHHSMKAYWGSRGTGPHILDLGSIWR
jgi:hypothetical protein